MLKDKHLPFVLAAIMVVAIFTRLWNIGGSLQFLGDQGRDAMIVARIFRQADPVFIGPVTSVGNMYLGPLYYYFMAPFLWMSYPSPVGPAYGVAVLGILTVFLLYWLGKEMVSKPAALVAAGLMAGSSIAATYSRFSWNPNPAPFVSLIMMYATFYAWKKNAWGWIGVAICFAILIQLHYLTLLSAAGAGLIWALAAYQSWKELKTTKKSKKDSNSLALKRQVLATMIGAGLVVASLTPLILFDSRHGWLNAKAFQNMIVGEENFIRKNNTLPIKIAKAIKETHGRSMHIVFETTIGQQRLLNTILVLGLIGILGATLYKKSSHHPGLVVLVAFLATGILGTSVYEHTVFDHYIAYLFPAVFLILGYSLVWLWSKKIPGKVIATGFVVWFAIYNLPRMPLKDAGWTIYDMERASQTIYERVKPGEKYNLVLLSGTGDIDAQNYRYFLETTDRPPVSTEERGEVETLFIINEDRQLPKVTDSPVYEIVVFPDKDPKEVYTISGGPEITVLRKSPTPENTSSN